MPVERDDISIVLTGTIIPNAPYTAYNDPQQRRHEYLQAINFYRQFAPVYFLENSAYRLADDAEFNAMAELKIRKMPMSKSPERGKGFQEFEMIDGWLAREQRPPRRWIKITGRYLYRNFTDLIADCRSERQSAMIIDCCGRSQIVRSCLFCVETDYYQQHIAGVYRECNDDAGEWIDMVLYRLLARLPESDVRMFSLEPRLAGVSGSTGGNIETKAPRYLLKRILRKVNYAIDRRQLWYTRG